MTSTCTHAQTRFGQTHTGPKLVWPKVGGPRTDKNEGEEKPHLHPPARPLKKCQSLGTHHTLCTSGLSGFSSQRLRLRWSRTPLLPRLSLRPHLHPEPLPKPSSPKETRPSFPFPPFQEDIQPEKKKTTRKNKTRKTSRASSSPHLCSFFACFLLLDHKM